MFHPLAALVVLSATGYSFFVLFAAYSALRRQRSVAFSALRISSEPLAVTILKPCAGADDDLEACLESYCAIRYPRMQLVFGVRDRSDPAHAVIEAIRRRHPRLDITVVISGDGRHASPKVANLEVMARAAKHPLLWLSDSNTRVRPDTLVSMVAELAPPGVGAVVSPIVGDDERSCGSAIENVHLNGFVASAGFVAAALIGLPAFPGKSVLIARKTLDAIGSWEELGRYAGEDIVLFKRVAALGAKLVVGSQIVTNVSREATVGRFLGRHLRWAQIRWRTVPLATVFEPLLSPFLVAFAFATISPGRGSFFALATAALLQLGGDTLLIRIVRGRPLAAKHLWTVWVRPFLTLWIWARALFVSRIEWRGHAFRMGPQSAILPSELNRPRFPIERAQGLALPIEPLPERDVSGR